MIGRVVPGVFAAVAHVGWWLAYQARPRATDEAR